MKRKLEFPLFYLVWVATVGELVFSVGKDNMYYGLYPEHRFESNDDWPEFLEQNCRPGNYASNLYAGYGRILSSLL